MTSGRAGWHSGPMDALRGRWRADCASVAAHATAETVDEIGIDLLRRWHEPHRHYHDATHLTEVLAAVDALCAVEGVNGSNHAVAALATWFHDAVYAVDPAADNEAESATLAAQQLGRLPVDPDLAARIVAVVLDTASHELTPQASADPARVVVHDADLTLRTGLVLAGISVAKLFLFDLAATSGLVRSVAFIVIGLLLLAIGSRYAKAYEHSRLSA